MNRRAPKSGASSLSTIQFIGLLMLLLGCIIGLAFLFAPKKPPAPPPSISKFEKKPFKHKLEDEPDEAYQPLPNPLRPKGSTRLAAQPKPEATPAPKPKYSITGTVTDAKTKTVLDHARVSAKRALTPAEHDDWNKRNDAALKANDLKALQELTREAASVQATYRGDSDAEGHYKVEVPQSGEFTVEAIRNGYTATTAPSGPLDDTTPEAKLDFALTNGASISGRITEAGTSAPAPEVTVRIDEKQIYRGMSDEKGNYEIAGLPPGEYGVSVQTAGSPYKQGKTIPFQKVKINKPDDAIKNVNFSVEPAGIVWGYVMTPDKKPIPGADVVLCGTQSMLTQALTSAVQQQNVIANRTKEDGYFELLGVPLDQEWQVYTTSNDSAPQLANPFILNAQSRSIRLDIFMFPGTNIFGRVVDTDKKPIPGADVQIMPALAKLTGPLETPQAFRNAKSDVNGEFKLTQLSPGNYQVFARKDGYKFATNGDPVYPDGYTDISNFDVVLYPMGGGSHVVFGTVVDTRGNPVSGASVKLTGVGNDSMAAATMDTSTDGDGKFRFEGVENGTVRLQVTMEGYAPQNVRSVRIDQETHIVLTQAAVVRGFVLVKETNQPPGVAYTVGALPVTQSGDTSTPGTINMAQMGNIGAPTTFNAPDGSFQLLLQAGTYRLEGRIDALTPARQDVTLTAGQVVDNVTLLVSQQGGTISGVVEASDGSSVQGATALLFDFGAGQDTVGNVTQGDPMNMRNMRLSSDGLFSFSNLPAGQYKVIVQHDRFATGSSDIIDLAENQTRSDIKITLGGGGMLQGTVSRNGKPVSGAIILVVSTATGTSKNATSDDSGNYSVDGLATGTYEVTATILNSGQITDLYSTAGSQVQIVEGQTTRHDFGGPGTTIDGKCTPPARGLVGGIAVLRLTTQPGPNPGQLLSPTQIPDLPHLEFRLIGPDGGFQIEGVQPGNYFMDIYYPQIQGTGGGLQLVHSEPLTVQNEPEMQLPLAIQLPAETEGAQQ